MFRFIAAAMLFAAFLPAAVAADAWTPPPKGQDAYDTLRHLYGELLRFKSDPAFLRDQWMPSTGFASFKLMVDGMDKDTAVAMALIKNCNERKVPFCMPSDLGRLGSAYYRSKGAETDETRKWRKQFDAMLGVDSEVAQRPAAVQIPEDNTIEVLRTQIEKLEADKKEHAKLDNRGDVKRLTKEIRDKKTALNRLIREQKETPAAEGE